MSKQSTSGGSGVGGDGGNRGEGGKDNDWRSSLNGGDRRNRKKPGILRLDISKPRRSSGGSVEFRAKPEMLGEDATSPSGPTSPHQLSVTWASQCDFNDPNSKAKQMLSHLEPTAEKGKRSQEDKFRRVSTIFSSPSLDAFVEQNQQASDDEDDDEEYSVSVSAIMQKRASIRGNRRRGSRKSRRASSPMDHIMDTISQTGDRRRSSVYTTSSDDGTNQDSTQEQIYENIRLHKEVIQSVKLQPWNIRKKLKLVRQAKTYVARHEGALQERFALSRSVRDLWARFKILMAARWRHWKREMSSFLTVLIPWELRIKEIESHFGSGVASYFTFLRWLLWVNIMIAIPLVAFVITPEVLMANPNEDDPRKKMSDRELKVAGDFNSFWEFEGYFKYSPLFYGYYSSGNEREVKNSYNLPLAYFLTAVAVYIYSFVATLRKMAENSRNSKLSSKDDECIFSWKLFTGWDFMIGHAETANNRIASVVLGFKETLLEEAEKKKDNRNWRIIIQRVLVNIVIIGLLVASGGTIVYCVDRSETIKSSDNIFRRNEVNIVMGILSFFLPMIFDALGMFENCHPRQQLRLQLARIMILNLLNLYTMMFSFIIKITGKDESLQLLKGINQNATTEKGQIEKVIASLILASNFTTPTPNNSNISDFMTSSTMTPTTPSTTPLPWAHLINQTKCFTVPVNCSRTPKTSPTSSLTTSMLLLNLSTTMLPNLWTSPSTTPSTFSTTPYDVVTNTVDFLTSTIDFNDSTTGTGSTTVDSSTDYDWSSTSTMFYSTSPPPSSTTREDIRPEFNATFFDYNDYFDNFESLEEGDTDEESDRVKRSIEDSTRSTDTEDTSSSSDVGIESTSPYSTEYSTAFSDDPYSIGISSNPITLAEFTETMFTVEGSTDSTTVRDKVLEYITTLKPYELDTSPPSTTFDTTTDDNIGSDGQTEKAEEEEEVCMETFCITLPPDLFILPTLPTTVLSSTTTLTSSTTLSTITTMTPANQIEYHKERLRNITLTLESVRRDLTTMCWETSLGQELSKIVVFDMIMSMGLILLIDFLRALFVRYMNKYWCWDMEKTFPQYGDFKIAENILNLVYNQGQVWMGIFFSPGLVIINFVKLIIFMYLRSWIVLTCNVPHEVVFKASKSNNFYLALLLMMLFLCVLPVGYAIVWLRPSWHCGPFSEHDRISDFFTKTIINALPTELHKPLEYLTSSSTVIPLLVLLTLIIYYLVSLTGALREANQDLRNQLLKEREEERKKMFKSPETKTNEQAATALTNRWRKVLEASSPATPTGPGGQQPPDFDEAYKNQARKELLARIMKKALRKGSATSEDDSFVKGRDEDDTDTEHHESLPHDEESKEKIFGLSKLQNIRRTRKPSIVDIVQIAKEQNKIKTQQPKGRFKIEKVEKAEKPVKHEKNIDHDNDPETNSRVVSERRMSLMRKQPQDSETTADPVEAMNNFTIINEKATDTLKKHKRKNPQSEPKVFKFDEKSVERNKAKEAHKPDETAKKDHQAGDEKKPTNAVNDDDKPDIHDIFSNFSKQGRKRIGNFMTLMRDAVKKVEPNSPNGDSPPPRPSSPEPEHEVEHQPKPEPKSSEAQPTPKPFTRPPLEKSVPAAPIDSEEDDQIGPTLPPVRTGSLRWADRPTPTRQDSQTSVWSDNIPTITISTTGSDECILENSLIKAAGTTTDEPNEIVDTNGND